MRQFLIRRFFFAISALIGATLITFFLSRIAGDPRFLYAQEGGYGITQERWDALGVELGLDKPIIWQYAVWLGRIVKGDWQDSLLDRKDVLSKIKKRLPPTLKVGFLSYVFATVIGIPLGVLSAVKRGTVWDYLARAFALFGQALPVFWVGIMLILIFSVQLRWLPTGTLGEGSFSWKHYVMPTVTLGWIAAATYLRLVRSSMLEILDSEFIKLARAKGVSNNAVIWKHGFRNGLIAPLTFSSLLLTGFITGAVVTETIFSIPGLGRLAFDAINNNDFPIMVGTVLVFTAMYVFFNFVTDVLYAYIDPRIRYA
ncbi:MAG: ABC transporter permease [SAR202 cluster bacterium]|jgi:ABC-type dipeptide/oligopeptide/nickel transport system permease component|nr:ABC transporter permease [Chloroflexota bacterium]MDP6422897.1 ABC transporter permease [SAR202 cluster bacterium]MDP6665475.1 ABC transporter permease [SAR202 cluster bacterium]MDP6798269.1 ABC transporter permease [SAR202 cluster bacterium]MQG58962.1 ABC transporter permease [SAR202 cluster bacterium]|tara:strand:+ start:1045 stop:1983 length:939 start_codon:yes stop_codon:yes gene_type:complete